MQKSIHSVDFSHDTIDVYDEFAPYFDRLIEATGWARRQFEILDTLLQRLRIARPARLLDLGCGTGRVAQDLSDAGYRVTGLDRSPEMIRLARDRASNAELIIGTWSDAAKRLAGREPFDFVYSLSQSLTHATIEEIPPIFTQVRSMLAPTGHFLFDVRPWVVGLDGNIEPGRPTDCWRLGPSIVVGGDPCWIDSRCWYQARRQFVEYRIRSATQDSRDKYFTVSYNTMDVHDYARLLAASGFGDIETSLLQDWPYIVVIAKA